MRADQTSAGCGGGGGVVNNLFCYVFLCVVYHQVQLERIAHSAQPNFSPLLRQKRQRVSVLS
jgi:hypothetical protein